MFFIAKPGFKEIKENKHKVDFVGILKMDDDGVIAVDVSEHGDGSDMVDVRPFLEQFNNENIKLGFSKVETEEL